jgi:DNA repair protein RadC
LNTNKTVYIPFKKSIKLNCMKQTGYRVAELKVSYHPTKCRKPRISSAQDAFKELYKFYPQETIALQEQMVVMYLARNARVLGIYSLSIGGITSTIVDPRLILSVALTIAATKIIISHNHPSGTLRPSDADCLLTEKLKQACKYLDITLDDHIIVTPNEEFYSFAQEGLI